MYAHSEGNEVFCLLYHMDLDKLRNQEKKAPLKRFLNLNSDFGMNFIINRRILLDKEFLCMGKVLKYE